MIILVCTCCSSSSSSSSSITTICIIIWKARGPVHVHFGGFYSYGPLRWEVPELANYGLNKQSN